MSSRLLEMGELFDKFICNTDTDINTTNRVFDPTEDPKYETCMPTPYEVMVFNPKLQVTFLSFSHKYKPSKSELKTARNIIRRAGIPAPSLDTPCYPLADTLVIELASIVEDGFAVAVRYFGYHSGHNRWEDDKTALSGLVKCVTYGCKQIQNMIEADFKWVKRVIFQTDSAELIDIVTQFDIPDEQWPPEVQGIKCYNFILLHLGITALRNANGTNATEVLFWKVASEYLPGAYHQAEHEQRIVHPTTIPDIPVECCGHCVTSRQVQELMFAETGNPGGPNANLVAKYGHLKKGDTFPLTNNSRVDAKVTMKVDGSVAADALKKKDANAAKVTGGKECGHWVRNEWCMNTCE